MVSVGCVNLYTRILQLTFDSAGADMILIVNALHPGTPHSKVLQRGVISPEVGEEAVKKCPCGQARGLKG